MKNEMSDVEWNKLIENHTVKINEFKGTETLCSAPEVILRNGHDRGIKVICAALRDAGMEVIYTGLRQTPEQIVAAAVQEDADVIAMSVLSGAHNYLFPRVMDLVKEKGIADVLVMGGGIIPEEDIPSLKQAGIAAIFGPGTDTGDIIGFIRENVRKK